jgi:hypothetical protein
MARSGVGLNGRRLREVRCEPSRLEVSGIRCKDPPDWEREHIVVRVVSEKSIRVPRSHAARR